MGRNIAMLVLAVLSAAGMAGILTIFYRRLRRIEEKQWGDKADIGGGILSLFRRRKR